MIIQPLSKARPQSCIPVDGSCFPAAAGSNAQDVFTSAWYD